MSDEKKESKGKKISRRQFLAKAGTAAAAAGAFSLTGGFPYILKGGLARASTKKFEGRNIRILTWTDETGKAALKYIAEPFQKLTGANVISDLTGATSEMVAKVKASASKPQFDVIILSGVGAIELAKAGLLQKPDVKMIPNIQNVFPNLRIGADGFGVGYFLWCDGLIYNNKVFKHAPATYEVLWDKKHSGKIYLPPPQWIQAMELTVLAASMAGGSARNPDPGFKKLKELKGRVLTMGENPPQIAELFRANALDVGGVDSAQMYPNFIRNPNYHLSATLKAKEGFFYDLQFMIIPKGHPGDDEVAYAFIDYALDPVVQGKMSEAVWYGPINKNTILSDKAKKSPYIVTPDVVQKRGIVIDTDYLATVREDWIRRYTEIFGM
jgi:putative spermidine/putrescine transport system substrate-binding protein